MTTPSPVSPSEENQPPVGAPGAAGVMTPQPPEGEMESAKLDVFHAVRLLDRAIQTGKALPSEARNDLVRARVELTKRFGPFEDNSKRFSDAEIASMVAKLKGPGTPPAPPNAQAHPPHPPQQSQVA